MKLGRDKPTGGSLFLELLVDGEHSEVAALREVYEETGLLGTAVQTAQNLVEGGGDVVWIEIDVDPSPISWESMDDNISEVGWCLSPPVPLAWDLSELELFSNYDWRAR